MRLLKGIIIAIIAATAVVGGLVVAAVVGAAGLLIVLLRRLLGRPAPRAWSAPASSRPRPVPSDVIDVSATEVPGPPSAR